MKRTLVVLSMLTLFVWIVPGLHAQEGSEPKVQLGATLDSAQEVPAPMGTSASVGGTATLTFDTTDSSISYSVSAHDLTGDPVLGHIHMGVPGTPGAIVVALPTLPRNDGVTVTGSVGLPAANIQDLYDGSLYVNLHTQVNPSGELRGQITLNRPPGCSCGNATSAQAFKACVKSAIKALGKDAKKLGAVKDLRKSAKKASCGKTKGPKKAVACCLPQTPIENVVIGHLCAAVPDKACPKLGGLGGMSLGPGSSCFPTNPCGPPAAQ